ncbi:MAG TPA: flagellar basal-body MS-ring/collar protein FliF [Alphaproteobacteria bacterium]|nr:flagellar basal-body MS-ring/collar protein FliF [Alphaproteobacteria bacterium]
MNAFRSLGPGRILALFFGLAAAVAITGLTLSKLQQPGLSLLYGGLNTQETSRIAEYLGTQNIQYETRGEGAVYAPSDKIGELRLQLAGQGLVGGSNQGYELFDNQSAFGTTNFVQNLNARRALEGELARTIGTIPAISSARVHIVMPKENLFAKEQTPPSAAIALNVGTRILEPAQVQSIAAMVAAAVPNLTLTNVTIIDTRGTLLFDGKSKEDPAVAGTDLRRGIEKQYEQTLTSMLERVAGPGQVAVRVTADINLDKVQENSELFDPTQQVVRSEQTSENTSTSADGSGNAPTGVQGNTPGAAGAGAGGGSNSNETRSDTTTNYEISKTVRSLTRAGGEIKKLSVAVLLATPQADPTAPAGSGALTDAQKAKMMQLVQSAIGYNADRGDKVEVVDMPFATPPEPVPTAEPFMSKADMLHLAQYGLLAVALLIVALLVVKPALSTLNAAISSPSMPAPLPPLQAMGAVAGGSVAAAGGEAPTEESLIDIRRVQGRVRESSVKKVQEVVDQNPEESLNVVRGWMSSSGSGGGNEQS